MPNQIDVKTMPREQLEALAVALSQFIDAMTAANNGLLVRLAACEELTVTLHAIVNEWSTVCNVTVS